MRTLIASALVAAGVSFVAAPAQAVEVRTCATTPTAAHRGITDGGVTENSRASVRAAITAGAYPEVDLRETSDKKIVLMHDATLRRTTRGTGRVSSLSGRKVRSHRLNDGQMVPYATGILRMVRDNPSAHIILDLKTLGPRAQRDLRDAIREYGIARRVEMISFHKAQIAAFRPLNPGVRTYFIAGALPSVRVAARNGGAHVFPKLITSAWASAMNDRGIPFSGRIDDTRAGWDAAVDAGVTSVMSDSVSGYRTWCGSGGAV